MKAVFTTRVEPTYDDLPEFQYHFPRAYLRQAEAAVGDWIVYYEPRRGGETTKQRGRQAYFATARVTAIVPDARRADHFYAYVADYLSFPRPVPFQEGGHYYERQLQRKDGGTSKGAFGRAVRLLAEQEYEEIVSAGMALVLGGSEELAASPEPVFGLAEPAAPFERPIVERLVSRPLRDAAFAATIREAYDNTCVMTGLRLINGGGRPEVQAAHIRPVASAGPDSPRNGLALSGTVHWMFDRGLVSVADDHAILVAEGQVADAALRLIHPDRSILPPSRADFTPHPAFLRWHRENVFKGR